MVDCSELSRNGIVPRTSFTNHPDFCIELKITTKNLQAEQRLKKSFKILDVGKQTKSKMKIFKVDLKIPNEVKGCETSAGLTF